MDDKYRYIVIIAGIIAIVYIAFRYIIPLLLKLFGIIVSFVAYTIAVAIAIAIVILIIGYVSRIYKSHNL
jgi:type IV secretory pathway TrbD component